MWQVSAHGTKGGSYVYEVDAPDYAPADAVFNSACLQHAKARRDRNITEYLDVREGAWSVRLLYPQGQRAKLDKIIEQADKGGITLHAEDIEWVEGEPEIDGMSAPEWVETLAGDHDS
jgi:hypothetical protein